MIFIIFFIASLITFLPTVYAVRGVQTRDDSSADISNYLYYHNFVRMLHGAAPLTWSEDLASGAQDWANACLFEHSDGVLSEMPYGENISAATGNFGISDAVQSFIADEESYDPSSPTFSDFTQVVWKDTTSVGCAYNTQCSNILSGQATIHVCLYNPPGNVVGQASGNVQV